MLTKRLQTLLAFIALLTVGHASASHIVECTTQAWVRAPDLVPDTVVRGDARVKISADCPTVEEVMLGLRLKERSFIKILRSREDKDKLDLAQSQTPGNHPRLMSAWDFPHYSCPNATLQAMRANKDLWIVREEERIVFETTQAIQMIRGASGSFDIVQDFSVLVPSTNFPPSLDCSRSMVINMGAYEVVDVEFEYEYFVRVPYANGTTQEIAAGITSFQPLQNPAVASRQPTSANTELEPMRMGGSRKDYITRYVVEVSGNLVFTQGSEDQVVTVVVTRTGPARMFSTPLMIRGCMESTISSKWAIEYGVPGLRPTRNCGHGSVLRATPEDVEEAYRNQWSGWGTTCDRAGPGSSVPITMPNSTLDEIQSGNIVTTTSAAVTIPIKVNRRQVTDFETFYQTLTNSLHIMLTTPRTEDESVDPDEPAAKAVPIRGPTFTDDEEPWVPFENSKPAFGMQHDKSWATYSGSISAVVLPTGMGEVTSSRRCPLPHPGSAADMLGQVILPDKTVCEQPLFVHYLDDGARGPVFVDSSAVHELLAEDPVVRDRRAPILQPSLSSPPEGEEVVYRFYGHDNRRGPLIYVGETWVKKVVNRGEHIL